MKLSIVSGGFDPIHEGHIANIQEAFKLSWYSGVIAIVNSDEWLIRKKGKYFQNFGTRALILRNIKGIFDVTGCDDLDDTVCDGLRSIRESFPQHKLLFCKGGDRTENNIPEIAICKELDIDVIYGVGGGKINSSSELLRKWNETI